MTKLPENHSSAVDEMLAAFTDQALNSGPDESTQPAVHDPELLALEQTVLQLKKTFASALPEAHVARRIGTRLEREWRLERQKKPLPASPQASGLSGLLKRFSQLFKVRQQRRLAFGFALACVVLLVGLVIFIPMDQVPPTGAAGMGTEWLPITIGFVVAAVAAIIWLMRPKGR